MNHLISISRFFTLICLFGIVYMAPTFSDGPRVPTLLISLDGFRADKLDTFLEENPSANIKKYFVNVGVKADYMIPSFPSLTFPNHFTLVTGLYMETHGIVANQFYDPNIDQKINFLSNDNSGLDAKWWNKAEPVWISAKNQGLKTFSFFWTGSEVWGRTPDIFLKYNERYEFKIRCDKVVNWFKKYQIDFGTLYFNEPDHTGHSFGPDSKQYSDKIKEVDDTIGYLIEKLEREGLLKNMNVIIVSDHGMAQMTKTIVVKDVVDEKLIDSTKTIYNIVSNIYPKNESDREKVYQAFKKNENFEVYYKEEVPERLHYQNSERIAPIVVICKEGFALRTTNSGTFLNGNHGFDNTVKSMRAIFLARGPDFVQNGRIEKLNNVDIYPLLCVLLKIDCNKNNGTLNPFLDILTHRPLQYLTKLKFD
jgi:ectonucleotide pyrophosphatase/phosphodiesterase family member 5